MEKDFEGALNVPLTKECQDSYINSANYNADVLTLELTKSEIDCGIPLFYELNQALGLLIDTFEDEEIKDTNLERAKAVVLEWSKLNKSTDQASLARKFLLAIDKAIKLNSFVGVNL